jgi:hypothetical protein
MNSRLPVAISLCLALLAALPTWASARSTQLSIIQDDAKVIASGDQTRNATLDEMRGLGADVIKISISWRALANGGKPTTRTLTPRRAGPRMTPPSKAPLRAVSESF